MRLIILGSGGYGRVIADVASQLNKYEDILFLDDNDKTADVSGKCCDFERYLDDGVQFYPAFGNNQHRVEWIEGLRLAGAEIASIIHPTVYVSPTVQIGCGTVIMPQTSVGSYTVIETGVIVNMGAVIDHNCVIGKGAHVCLGAIVKADNHIPEFFKVEAGSVTENKTYR